jgi:hypothetical protein
MRITWKAAMAGAGAVVLGLAAVTPAGAEELSEKSVRSIMDYAWAMIPQQFTQKDGKVIVVDKTKRDDVMVPLDVAREVIRVGRISAHAQVCNLPEDQALNHRSLMKREVDKKKWSDQQQLYINQLHLTTVMLLTGKIKVVETGEGTEPGKEPSKEVVVDEKKEPAQTCSDEQKAKVKELIAQYVKSGPALAAAPSGVGAAAAAAAAPAAAAATEKGATEAKAESKPAEKKQ